MTLFDLLSKFGIGIASCGNAVVVLSLLVQFSPIKINPWSALFNWIKKHTIEDMNKYIESSVSNAITDAVNSIKENVEQLTDKIEKLHEQEVYEREKEKALTCRRNVISFADGVSHGNTYSSELWNQTLEDITYYERFCEQHPDFPNGKAVSSIKMLKTVYQELLLTGGIK